MINPDRVHTAKGIVTELRRSPYNEDISLKVTLDNGHTIEEIGFVYHKTLKVGDRVSIQGRFSIMSDRYGIINVRKTKRGA